MLNLFAKIAMVISLGFYVVALGAIWLGQMLGWHNDIWDLYDFPIQADSPPMWTLLIGSLVTVLGLISLGAAYLGIWRILSGGPGQDFRALARNLKRLGLGLIGFWLCYNILAGGVQYLIAIDVQDTSDFEFYWDPLDLDIVFVIVGIGVLAISRTMERAWRAEDEVQHFL